MPLIKKPVSVRAQHLARLKILKMMTGKMVKVAKVRGLPEKNIREGERLVNGLRKQARDFVASISPQERLDAEIEKSRLYSKTSFGKESRKRYRRSKKGKATMKEYHATEAYRGKERRYTKSEKGIERERRYLQSERGMKTMRAATKRYKASKKGRMQLERYRLSEKSRVAQRKYWESEQGKQVQKRFSQSEKGKAVQKRYRATEKGRRVIAISSMRSKIKAVLKGKRIPRLRLLGDVLKLVFPENKILGNITKGSLNKDEIREIMQAITDAQLLYKLELTGTNFSFIHNRLMESIRKTDNQRIGSILIAINNAMQEKYQKTKTRE